jgi:predicted membrane-bound spermidine synthase
MHRILGITFFLSGVAGLVFETLWFRMAGLTFGSSVWATTLVLASFMGGLALGNALAVRFGFRFRRPLVAFSLLEIMVGLTGFGLVIAFPHLPRFFAPVFGPLLEEPLTLNLLRFGISFSLLLIPTTSMGLTLPLVVKALNRSRPDFGKSLGHLYGWNTLGAMVGAVLGEELLIGILGIRGSAAAATTLNCTAALLALIASRRFLVEPPAEEPVANRPPMSWVQWRILAAAFLSGGVFLALEVVWFRFLQLFVPSTTRSFAFMLLMVLLGIGAGAFLSSLLLRSYPSAYRLCRHLALSAALLVLWSYILFEGMPGRQPGALSGSASELIAFSAHLMLPVSLVSGFLFTFLGRAFFETWKEETRAVGLTTLANTLGATLGAPIGAFFLLPSLGIERSLFALAIAYAVVAVLLPSGAFHSGQRAFRVSLVAAGVLLLGSLAFYPFGLMTNHFIPLVAGRFAHGETSILGYREGRSETIIYTQEYLRGEPYAKRLLTNSYTMSGVDLPPLRYMKFFVYWPLAFHPEVDKALLISYGVGSTAKALTDSREIDQIDIVDISREILEADIVIYPGPAESPLSDPRVTVYVEDGRFYLLTTKESYDLITAEPPPPAVSGVVNLYTLEYFQLLFNRLNEGGYATYWLPLENLSVGDAEAIVQSFCAVFGDCSLWRGAKLEMVLVGSRNARGILDRERFERQWRDAKVSRELEILGFETPALLLATFVGDSTFLKRWAMGRPPLVDDFPQRLRGDAEPEPEVYLRELGHPASRERYRESRFLKDRVPPALFEAGLAVYPYQELLDESLDAYPEPGPLDLNKLHRVLTETDLRTPVLWLLGDFSEFSEVIQSREKRPVQNVQNKELHLGFRDLADRNYRFAAERFEQAQRLAGGDASSSYYRILALAYDGQQEEAERLFAQLRLDGKGGQDKTFWDFCSRTLGLKIDASPISLQ